MCYNDRCRIHKTFKEKEKVWPRKFGAPAKLPRTETFWRGIKKVKFDDWRVEPEPEREGKTPEDENENETKNPTWSGHTNFGNNINCWTTTNGWVKVPVEDGRQPSETTTPDTIGSLQQMLKEQDDKIEVLKKGIEAASASTEDFKSAWTRNRITNRWMIRHVGRLARKILEAIGEDEEEEDEIEE